MTAAEAQDIADSLMQIAKMRLDAGLEVELANEVIAQLSPRHDENRMPFIERVNGVLTFLAAHAFSATRGDVEKVLHEIADVCGKSDDQPFTVSYVDGRTERTVVDMQTYRQLSDDELELRAFVKKYAAPVRNEFEEPDFSPPDPNEGGAPPTPRN
jgi:hypothetical protein